MVLTSRLAVMLLLGVLTFPFTSEGQPPSPLPRVGVLRFTSPPPLDPFQQPFRDGLRRLGYVEGKNILVEYRWADGKADRAAALAAELVRLKVDVIVASVTGAIQAAKEATTTIPIVMATAADPLGNGFVRNLAHPGGNITGLSITSPELAGKRLELLRQLLPHVDRIAFLGHPSDPATQRFLQETQAAGVAAGLRIQPVLVRGPADFDSAFSAMRRDGAGAVIVQPIFIGHRRRIAALAREHHLPSLSDYREFAEAGGLVSYGPNLADTYGRAAVFVDKILKGARPGDLPIEQPTTFELVINRKTATAINLTMPPSLLLRADHVIE